MGSNITILLTHQAYTEDAIHDYVESGKTIQDEITTTKYLLTCTMLVDTTVHTGAGSHTAWQWT